MAPFEAKMSAEARARSMYSPMFGAQHSTADLGQYRAPQYFPTVERNHAAMELVRREDWDVPIDKLKKGLMEGVNLDVFFPGFPTLKHIRHTVELRKAGVRVFEQSSRGRAGCCRRSRRTGPCWAGRSDRTSWRLRWAPVHMHTCTPAHLPAGRGEELWPLTPS